MKIAIITDRIYPLYLGGYEILLYQIATGLSSDHTIDVFTAVPDKKVPVTSFRLVKVSPDYKFVNRKNVHNISDSVKFNFHIKHHMKEINEYDVAILSTIPYYGYGSLLEGIKIHKISIFYEAWYEYLRVLNPAIRLLLPREIKRIVRNSDSIIAISKTTANSLIKNYGGTNVHVIPMGIESIKEYGSSEKTYDIGYIGRFSEIKHIDHILYAASKLKAIFPDIRIGLAGDGPLMSSVKEKTYKLGLEKHVEFPGRLDGEKKYEFLRSIKIFIMPSEREGFSMSTLEAMSCGAVPVVAEPKYSEVFGVSDFVINGVTGLYYPFGLINKLTENIKVLMTGKDQLSAMSKNAMESSKKYTWNRIVEQYNELIQRFLG